MTGSSSKLAVMLRRIEWEVDPVAYRLPREEVSAEEAHRLAGALRKASELLSQYAERQEHEESHSDARRPSERDPRLAAKVIDLKGRQR